MCALLEENRTEIQTITTVIITTTEGTSEVVNMRQHRGGDGCMSRIMTSSLQSHPQSAVRRLELCHASRPLKILLSRTR